MRKDHGVHDLGIVGWYRAVELVGDLVDMCRIGGAIRTNLGSYRIVRLATRSEVRPEQGGVVVLTEVADGTRQRRYKKRRSKQESIDAE